MKNQIFHRDELSKTPWKNGGGITREIACSEPGAPYWRLSLADVTQDGAFSTFSGLNRVLTVVEGAGMILKTGTEEIHANPLKPVSFSGETPVMGLLKDGPVQNFNLIYDATVLKAEAFVGDIDEALKSIRFENCATAIYCLNGSIQTMFGTIFTNSGILSPSGVPKLVDKSSGLVLLVQLHSTADG